MHGHRGFAGTGSTLYNQIMLGLLPNHLILFLLDGGNDFSQNGALILGQVLGKKFVVCHYIGIIEILKLFVLNFISTLSAQLDFIVSFAANGIGSLPQGCIVIHTGNGSSPVNYLRLRRIVRNDGTTDIIHFILL